uniref:PB1 domain-containing protein n=1 Tax=Hippocampus comes TaxID=109280 RepID=A0A3Q2YA07_HIPCM
MAAGSPQEMILRVVEPDQARKLQLSSRPGSIDALIKIIKELEIDLDFDLLFEDPDFDGKRNFLQDIEELPQKSVLHISISQHSSSVASTVGFSDASYPERHSSWPSGSFPVPTFGYNVELRLRDGNAEYEKNNTHLKLTRDQRHDILENIASTLYGFKAYPSDKDITTAAQSLVAKHPCLKEAGSETGYNGWKNSTLRQTIFDEVKKTQINLLFIKKMMEGTFLLRRQTIVISTPSVNELVDLWPALKIVSELYAEFYWIINVHLPNKCYGHHDSHIPRLLTLFRQKVSRTGKIANALAAIFKSHDEQVKRDNFGNTIFVRRIPVFLNLR